MDIHPIKLYGNWDHGWALDRHIISSTFAGYAQDGRALFDTKRTELGELVKRLKYDGDFTVVDRLADTAVEFLEEQKLAKKIDVVFPAPPTKQREIQPVYRLAEAIADRLDACYEDGALIKISSVESKNATAEAKALIAESVVFDAQFILPSRILLIDDLFASGSTLNACVDVLREDARTKKIYVLTMTKTKG